MNFVFDLIYLDLLIRLYINIKYLLNYLIKIPLVSVDVDSLIPCLAA